MKMERRFTPAAEVRVQKDAADESKVIAGYAAVFDSETKIGSAFTEVIRSGAFDRALKEKQDVRALFNHEATQILGRTKSGTLRLSVDKKGLRYEIDAPNTTIANDLVTSIERGDVDASSFAFFVRGQKWNENTKDGKTTYLREITDVDLLDVSPVTYPAYGATSVSMRSTLAGVDMPAEVRAAIEAECECECPECQDGNCDGCTADDCQEETCSCKQRSKAPQGESTDDAFRDRMERRLHHAEIQ